MMKIYDPQRRRVMATFLFVLAGVCILAIATRSDAMRPQDGSNAGCWNTGPGFPDPDSEYPTCFNTVSGADCYVCLYNPPNANFFDWCSENADGTEYICDMCDGPGMPYCPSSP